MMDALNLWSSKSLFRCWYFVFHPSQGDSTTHQIVIQCFYVPHSQKRNKKSTDVLGPTNRKRIGFIPFHPMVAFSSGNLELSLD
jgi:hypothetical protein